MIEKQVAGVKVGDPYPPRLMGVVNLSRESFYQGSYFQPEEAAVAARRMVREGASFLDLGARSTAPGVAPISEEEELQRLLPALESVLDAVDVPVSVDTQSSRIASEALEMGAHIINDVSGFKADPGMAQTVADHGAAAILMATRREPGDPLTVGEALAALRENARLALDAGVKEIILDPGVGRWVSEKTYEYNLALVDQFNAFKSLGHPLLAAVSRKSFIGKTLGDLPPEERLPGTLAATTIAVYRGAHVIRAHDVEATRDHALMAHALRGVSRPRGEYEVEAIDLPRVDAAREYLERLGVSDEGPRLMAGKTTSHTILIRNLTPEEALVVKQEMLARGGDAAIPHGTITHTLPQVDVLAIGTHNQMRGLIKKLRRQAFRLPEVAHEIEMVLREDAGRYEVD